MEISVVRTIDARRSTRLLGSSGREIAEFEVRVAATRQIFLFIVSQSDGRGPCELFAAHFAGEFAIDADSLKRHRALPNNLNGRWPDVTSR